MLVRNVFLSFFRGQQRDTDMLLRKLVEAEIDGIAVANQLTALKDTIDGLAQVGDHFENTIDQEDRR